MPAGFSRVWKQFKHALLVSLGLAELGGGIVRVRNHPADEHHNRNVVWNGRLSLSCGGLSGRTASEDSVTLLLILMDEHFTET